MKVVRNEEKETQVLTAMEQEYHDPEREGWQEDYVSVTDAIYCLTAAYYNRKMLPKGFSRRTRMLFATGLWFEKLVLHSQQVATKGVTDDISWHTDHYDGEILKEVKSTRANMKNSYEELSPGWHAQLKAYCKVHEVTGGEVIIIHLMGDYKPPFPDIRVYDVEFTQEEIDDNWAFLIERRDLLNEYLATDTVPPPYTLRVAEWADREDFECRDCKWADHCKVLTGNV